MALKTYGRWRWIGKTGIDFDRFAAANAGAGEKPLLAESEMGALLCFDMNNVRTCRRRTLGRGRRTKSADFRCYHRMTEPILWDFGSAARHHQQTCPWLGERSRPGIPLLRGGHCAGDGARGKRGAQNKSRTREGADCTRAAGDRVVEPPILFALQKEGSRLLTWQQLIPTRA